MEQVAAPTIYSCGPPPKGVLKLQGVVETYRTPTPRVHWQKFSSRFFAQHHPAQVKRPENRRDFDGRNN